MQTYGYVRVSSREQNSARQVQALRSAGVSYKNIFIDYASGKNFAREQYQSLKAQLCRGDIIIIKSIDRLGRNYHDIIEEWKYITKTLYAHIRVIDLPLLDTNSTCNDLTGTFISDIVLQILSYVAEQERNNIRQRQSEGIALAKARGVHMGRPRIQKPANFDTTYDKWRAGEIKFEKALKLTGLKRSTFERMVREKREELSNYDNITLKRIPNKNLNLIKN